jgi:hypothetical protein
LWYCIFCLYDIILFLIIGYPTQTRQYYKQLVLYLPRIKALVQTLSICQTV